MMSLTDKVAIVTGAGIGIGRATTLLFAQQGARVVACDINEETGNETVRLVKESGGEASFVRCDVSKSGDVQEMVAFAISTYGGLSILYNNASIVRGHGSCVDITEEDWDLVHAVNVKGTFLCCKYAIPELIKQPSSSIINTSSGASLAGHVPGDVPPKDAYATSKGAMLSLTKSIATHYGRFGLRANVICPGVIDTEMTAHALTVPAIRKAILHTIPLGRIGNAEDVANVALFLSSDFAAFISGCEIIVDGGAFASGGRAVLAD